MYIYLLKLLIFLLPSSGLKFELLGVKLSPKPEAILLIILIGVASFLPLNTESLFSAAPILLLLLGELVILLEILRFLIKVEK